MAVKVPPLLHKMSASAQKAWYKKHGMEMPAKEKSAATAGKMKAPEPKKAAAAASDKPKTAREISMERQKAYYAKGGRQPIGAGGSGGHSAMAGVGQSSAKEIIKGIRAGVNPKSRGIGEEVSLDEGKMKDVATDRQETERLKAQEVLGGKVKTRTGTEPKGKLPLGFRSARNLARKAMKAGTTVTESTAEVKMSYGKKLAKAIMAKQSKHPIAQQMGEEVIVEQDDAMEKKEMAQTQLHFIGYAAKEILEFIDMGGEIEEWYQNKLSKVQSEVESLHSYIEGEKRRTGMVEETEQVDEKIDLEKAKMGDVIKDFQKSDAPQFKGKSMEKRREMAIAAKLGAERGMKEEAEQIDELKKSTLASYVGKAAGRLAAASRLQKDFERDGHTALAGEFEKSAQKKKVGIQKAANKLAKEEAEGTVAVTPKEKALAAHHGDKTKITYGDVIKARLKSAAAKKMGK
jgi:hypothetical protein